MRGSRGSAWGGVVVFSAAPFHGTSAPAAQEGEPLNEEEKGDAEGMEEDAGPALLEAKGGCGTGEKVENDGEQGGDKGGRWQPGSGGEEQPG